MSSKIKKIEIDNLFDRFNHIINFRDEEPITIIQGVNGVGKTTALKLIYFIFRGRFNEVQEIKFSEIRFYFMDDSTLAIKKIIEERQVEKLKEKFFTVSYKKSPKIKLKTGSIDRTKRHRRIPRPMIEEEYPYLRRVAPDVWVDKRTGERLDYFDIYEGNAYPLGHFQIPNWVVNILEEVSVHFIVTQRLQDVSDIYNLSDGSRNRKRKKSNDELTLLSLAEDLGERIRNVTQDFASIAQQLDRNLLYRLLSKPKKNIERESILREKLINLQELQNRLIEVGLMSKSDVRELPEKILTETENFILSVIVEDTEKKLEVYNDLFRKVEIFLSIVNNKLHWNDIRVDQTFGFIAVDMEANSKIPLSKLSSGEQHEIVLVYELLFRADKGSLILIDEPELSLHVTWQRSFLKDLTIINELGGLYSLVATHSPQIINERWDLTERLGGIEDE